MDSENFLASRTEICERLLARRTAIADYKLSRWSWLGDGLAGTVKMVAKMGGGSGFESLIPKLMLPLAAPIAGLLFGLVKEKGFSLFGKKPLWARFVPFL